MALTSEPPTVQDPMHSVGLALARVQSMTRLGDGALIAGAEEDLRLSIDAAVAAGLSWGTIGECLGMARGNAYQKYRRRSPPPTPPVAPPL